MASVVRSFWLYRLTRYKVLGAFIRGLAAFFLCHDYVMSTIYVACTTMILAGGAIFYGWIFRDLRQIVTLTRQLSQSEKGVEILATQKSIAEAQTHAARVAKEDTESLYDKIVEELSKLSIPCLAFFIPLIAV